MIVMGVCGGVGEGTVAELTFAGNPVGSHRETIVLELQATGGRFFRVFIRAGLEHGGIREETGSQTGYLDGGLPVAAAASRVPRCSGWRSGRRR